MTIQPAQPQSIGGVLDVAFQLYRASLMRVIPLCLLLAIASSPPSLYLLMQGTASTDPLALLAAMRSPTYWLTYVIGVLASLWALGALYFKMGAIGAGSDIGVGSALQTSAGRVPLLFLAALLFTLAVAIGCLLLLVPGLILMVSLMLCFNLMLFEGKGPIDSLMGSHRLVWGNWWRTAAVLTVGGIIVIVIYLLAGVVIGIVLPLLALGSEDPLATTLLTSLIVSALMSLFVTPFYLSVVIAVYWDLKLRKEGGDLSARVSALNPA